jgi:hypothetical protein
MLIITNKISILIIKTIEEVTLTICLIKIIMDFMATTTITITILTRCFSTNSKTHLGITIKIIIIDSRTHISSLKTSNSNFFLMLLAWDCLDLKIQSQPQD